MKTLITTVFLTVMFTANAQVIIGGTTGTAAVKTSVLLEFPAGQNKGIILPYVRTKPSGAAVTEGTILLDASSPANARVKYYNANTVTGTAGWADLSGQDANLNTVLPNFATEQPASTIETAGSKAIIGASSSAADGVLVLESTTKAMVLPTVTNVQNITNPAPGMMVYVSGVAPNFKKRLAVFNGSKWSYWKPNTPSVPTVTSATGKVWMDRNLGATQVATSSTDVAAYGDLYQWGRLADGHQIKTSGLTPVLSTTDTPGNGNFITTDNLYPNDWRATPNNTLWQGASGTNNPCPSGFRLPTTAELIAEINLFSPKSTAGAFASILKIPAAGYRNEFGGVSAVATAALYWTSDISGTGASYIFINTGTNASSSIISRGVGFSVRCIQN